MRLFERAVAASGHPVVSLAQGEATGALDMAVLGPIGLALIRCHGGVGRDPMGAVDPADIDAGLDVLAAAVGALAGGTTAA